MRAIAIITTVGPVICAVGCWSLVANTTALPESGTLSICAGNTAPRYPASEPNHDATAPRLRRRRAWFLREHEGQFEAAYIAAIEERCGQGGEIGLAVKRCVGQVERDRVADGCPQRGVRRVFALLRVVADQLHIQVIEFGDEARIDGDIARNQNAAWSTRHRQGCSDFAIELRNRWQQRGE